MEIYVRYLQNDMKKSSYNGGLDSKVDSLTYKLLISNITSRSFILPNYVRYVDLIFAQFPRICRLVSIYSEQILYHIYNTSMLEETHATVNSVLRVLNITSRSCFQMVNVYKLLSHMQFASYPVLRF